MSYGDLVAMYCPDTVYTLDPEPGKFAATCLMAGVIIGAVFGGSITLFGNSVLVWIKKKFERDNDIKWEIEE